MPRRPASPAVLVVLAAVGALLAGVAGTGTYLGVSEYLKDQPAATRTPGGGGPTGPNGASTTPTPGAGSQLCPKYTMDAVQKGSLSIVLYVRGTRKDQRLDGEAWICRDSEGTLYYQGHDIDGKATVDGSNTLLIGGHGRGVVAEVAGTYVATRGSTVRRVSCQNQEFGSVGGTQWSVDVCTEGTGPSTLA